MATKPEQVEFYYSSIWGLKPYAVSQEIIPRLKGALIENAQYLFDNRRNWFQITCLDRDEVRIRALLRTVLEELERNVLRTEDDIIAADGVLMDFDNISLGLWDENALLESYEFTEHRFPETFKYYAFREVWELNTGQLSDIMSKRHFRELEKLHNVTLAHDLSLTEVYIGAESQAELDLVRNKLSVIVQTKALYESEPMHIMWTEAYKERDGFEMTFDTRVLANIDAAWITATFLDLAHPTGAIQDYCMLAEAITLRLCRWDETRQHHTSLIGPKLKARHNLEKNRKRRYRGLRRPGSVKNPYGAGYGPRRSLRISPDPNSVVNAASESLSWGEGDVEKWLNDLEESYGLDKPSQAGESSSMPMRIRDTSNMTSAPKSEQSLIVFDEPAVTAPVLGNLTLSLLDMDDPVVVSIKPLDPELLEVTPVFSPATIRAVPVPNTKSTLSTGTRQDIDVKEKSQATDPLSSTSRRGVSKNGTAASPRKRSEIPRPELAAEQLQSWFMSQMNQAVYSLLLSGPLLRGKVDLRADIGRILFIGMDYTALAFNAPGTISNGWKHSDIVRILNKGSRTDDGIGLTFTSILTQEEEDIQSMMLTKDIATAKHLWKGTLTEGVVYSFHCVSSGHSFFLDLKADVEAGKFKYTLRTKQDDKAPIWIHGTLRSWDARIVMSHVDTYALEAKYSDFAKSFVDSFAVSLLKEDHPIIQIGIHKGFGISVESMRIRTTYRLISEDDKAYLDITEIEETAFKPCSLVSDVSDHSVGLVSSDQWKLYTIAPKRQQADVRASEERGMPTFWYEASIRSVLAEKEMVVNQTMALGERAPWNTDRFRELGVIDSICKPVLRMVQTMDHVGSRNNNHQASRLVLPAENITAVPGATYLPHRSASPAVSSPVSTASARPRGSADNPVRLAQMAGPPHVVASRPPDGFGMPSSTHVVPATPVTPTAGGTSTQQAASLASNATYRNVASTIRSRRNGNDRNVVNTMPPPASALRVPATVPGQRDSARNRPQANQQRSSTSNTASDGSRGPGASYMPPNQFW